jgi:hypothetical protein
MKRSLLSVAVFGAIQANAFAQTEAPRIEKTAPVVEKSDELPEGWSFKGNASARFNIESSDKVAGQTDGASTTYGAGVDMTAKHKQDTALWDNELKALFGFTKTPALGRFTKSSDSFDVKSTYMYGIPALPEVGPYARFTLKTTIFDGREERAEDASFEKTKLDGSKSTEKTNSAKLTDGFSPVTTRESLGMFYKPIENKISSLILRAGGGAEQLSRTANQYTLDDNKDTKTVVEVKELEKYSVLGLEAGLSAKHSIAENIQLKLEAETLYPLSISEDRKKGKSNSQLVSWEVGAGVSAKLAEWLSANYELNMKKQPLVSDNTQVKNAFFLQATKALF